MMLPEKALLDLIYLRAGGDSPHYLGELRGQNLDRLDLGEHCRYEDGSASLECLALGLGLSLFRVETCVR